MLPHHTCLSCTLDHVWRQTSCDVIKTFISLHTESQKNPCGETVINTFSSGGGLLTVFCISGLSHTKKEFHTHTASK